VTTVRKIAKNIAPKPSKKLIQVRNSATEMQKMEMFLEEYYSNPGDIAECMKRLYHDKLNDNKRRGDTWFRNKGMQYLNCEDAKLKMAKKRDEIMAEYKITRDRILKPLLRIIDNDEARACDVISAAKLLSDKFGFFNTNDGEGDVEKIAAEESAREKLSNMLKILSESMK
jgi:hypothetical protein